MPRLAIDFAHLTVDAFQKKETMVLCRLNSPFLK